MHERNSELITIRATPYHSSAPVGGGNPLCLPPREEKIDPHRHSRFSFRDDNPALTRASHLHLYKR